MFSNKFFEMLDNENISVTFILIISQFIVIYSLPFKNFCKLIAGKNIGVTTFHYLIIIWVCRVLNGFIYFSF